MIFAEKYGDGDKFLSNYNNGKINEKEIKNELIIISSVIQLKEKKENIICDKKNNLPIRKVNKYNNSKNLDREKTPIGIRRQILIQKYKNDDNKNKQKI